MAAADEVLLSFSHVPEVNRGLAPNRLLSAADAAAAPDVPPQRRWKKNTDDTTPNWNTSPVVFHGPGTPAGSDRSTGTKLPPKNLTQRHTTQEDPQQQQHNNRLLPPASMETRSPSMHQVSSLTWNSRTTPPTPPHPRLPPTPPPPVSAHARCVSSTCCCCCSPTWTRRPPIPCKPGRTSAKEAE